MIPDEELQELRELQQGIISRMRGDAGLPELETVSKSEAYGSPEIQALLRQMNPRVKTERGLLNVAYRGTNSAGIPLSGPPSPYSFPGSLSLESGSPD